MNIISHFGGTNNSFVNWLSWELELATSHIQESLKCEINQFNEYITMHENIIGPPKMQNNFWCTIKVVINPILR